MLELILVRHGETDWNAAEVFRGRADVVLNETGLRQAELLGKYLAGVKIDAIFSSPLKRALSTAAAIAGHQSLEIIPENGLVDFDFGEWQGLSHRDVEERYPELYTLWINHPERVHMPAGESLAVVRERAERVVKDITGRYTAGRVVLVSHRVVHKVLICALLGLEDTHFWDIRLDTCGITNFDYFGESFILSHHNDTSFLKNLPEKTRSDF